MQYPPGNQEWSDNIFVSEAAFELIDTENAWRACLRHLQQMPRMAIDIEANSLHAYREKICLIQITTDECDYIIDPIADLELSGLGALFAEPAVEKVFHAADYDISLLKGLYGWEVNRLFDTMWAGRLLGFDKMGLAWFLETLYDIKLSKKCQKANWASRPLTEEKLIYAHNDTRYLLRMRDDLEKRLIEEGLAEEAREIFQDICCVEPHERLFDPEDFWRLKGARALPPRGQAVLKALFIFRDREAKRRNVPPFKVMNNPLLMRLALQAAKWDGNPPKRMEHIPGIPDKQLGRLKPRILKTVQSAMSAPIPKVPKTPRSGAPGYWQRYEALMQWRKEIAQARGVESDVVLGRRALEEIAEKCPENEKALDEIESLGPWRKKRYGAAILRVLK